MAGGTRVLDRELEPLYIPGPSPETGMQSELNIGRLNRNVHIDFVQSKRRNHTTGETLKNVAMRYIA